MNDRNRQRGTLIGLAVGDALGAAVEFESPGTFREVTGFRAGGPHGLAAGEWTDDTSMALALADSIGSVGWDLNDQARRYVAWRRRGEYSVNGRCFDIGGTTCIGLNNFERTGNARTSGDDSDRACGNGSIMRLAPVPIRFAHLFPDQLQELATIAGESSLPTHSHPRCVSACVYLTLVVCGLIHGLPREEVLSADWYPLRRVRDILPFHPDIAPIAEGSFRDKQPPVIAGGGYVVESLEAALWAFHKAADFREAVLKAVNLGDDADTTGRGCAVNSPAHIGARQASRKDGKAPSLGRFDMIEWALTGLLSEPERKI